MKVKKFRIRPRLPSVKKILKSLLAVKDLPEPIEQSLEQEAEKFVGTLAPLAFYQTWPQEDIPQDFRDLLKEQGFGKPLSVSALAATVGQGPEEEIAKLLLNGETQRPHVVTALAEESADQAFNFLYRLLTEDAEQDDCEVAEPVFLQDPPVLGHVLQLLSADQEGISMDQAQHLTPRFTRVGLVVWLPVSRKKKAKTLSKNA